MELDAELAAHLELAVEENMARGMSADEARRRALISFRRSRAGERAARRGAGLALARCAAAGSAVHLSHPGP